MCFPCAQLVQPPSVCTVWRRSVRAPGAQEAERPSGPTMLVPSLAVAVVPFPLTSRLVPVPHAPDAALWAQNFTAGKRIFCVCVHACVFLGRIGWKPWFRPDKCDSLFPPLRVGRFPRSRLQGEAAPGWFPRVRGRRPGFHPHPPRRWRRAPPPERNK